MEIFCLLNLVWNAMLFLMESKKRDEDLTRAYQSGEGQALDTLLEQYDQPLRNFIRTISWLKDGPFIDEVLQSTRVIIFEKLRSGGFIPAGAGSFKAWAYKICQNVCWNANKDRARQPKRISELYPEEPTGMPDDLLTKMPTQTVNYDQLATKLKDTTSHLSLEEQKLMTLVSQHKKYQEIQQDPDFAKYSLDYLMRKVYNIRKKMRQVQEKEKKK